MNEPDRPPAIFVENLRKEYQTPGEPLVVLDGVDLELQRSHSLAVMGPSGSGKSTLLHIIGTLDTPTSGKVALENQDPFAMSEPELARFRNRKIGFVFQDHQLLPQCTALENILIPALAEGRPGPETVERAEGLLDRMGLAQRAGHRPSDLSGGERQRVAIARALLNAPSILLCDEPTGNLDEATGAAIGDCFQELLERESVALVVVTHNPAFAKRFDRTLRLHKGKLA